ncbi:MAG: PHP domain-containing protein, partial [Lentisphaeria bacterium]|nr:PHP domain-containing protein [Lentisphaeria bacterium]
MNAADYPVSSYDLHAHTCWSFDAIEDPEAYFRRATELGITCIAVTDHFHLDSLPEVTEIA